MKTIVMIFFFLVSLWQSQANTESWKKKPSDNRFLSGTGLQYLLGGSDTYNYDIWFRRSLVFLAYRKLQIVI